MQLPISELSPIDGPLGALFAELAHLAESDGGVTEVLTAIARLAVAAVPGTAEASVRTLGDNGPMRLGLSDKRLTAIEEAQGRARGPSVQAAAERRTVVVGLDHTDASWAEIAAFARREAFDSLLAIPLGDDRSLGVLTLYANHHSRFDDLAVGLARRYARHAVGVVANALRIDELERVNRQLQEALASRDIIGQAKGVLRERFGYSDEVAFDELRRGSQRERKKLRDIAQVVIDSVGRGITR